jgi:integrase/recombinase XerD
MFEQFIKERQYLQNVSPRTVEWYKQSFKWLANPNPNKSDLTQFVIRMRERGLKPSSCNNRIRAVNAYLQWLESDLRVEKLKEEQRILPTFSTEDIQTMLHWKPKGYFQRRLHTLMMTLADTGCRIDEALSLKWTEVDFANLLLTVTGKGSKQRKIPFSFELRRLLYKWKSEHQLVFPTRRGRKLGRRDVLRDVKRTCKELGVRPPERTLHAFRHTFALNYLRRGGSVFHLQKCLGHSSLDMTRRYANLTVSDLQGMHEQVTLLRS